MSALKSPSIFLAFAAGILAAVGTTASSAPRQGRVDSAAQAVLIPESLVPAERLALLMQAAAQRRYGRVSAADVVEFLARQGRAKEAAPLAVAAMLAQPEKIGDISDAIGRVTDISSLLDSLVGDRDRPSGIRQAIVAVLPDLRSRIATLPRDLAAHATYVLLNFEIITQGMSRERRLDRMRAFIQEYSGTADAETADYEMSIEEDMYITNAVRLSDTAVRPGDYGMALERYARAHVGTVGGAQALYQYAKSKGQCCDNPADRFRETLKIVAELKSGKYPASEWVDRAAELVVEFSFDDSDIRKVSAEQFEFIVAAYMEFALAHLGNPSANNLPGFESLLIFRLPRLIRAQHVAGGMDRIFDELTRNAKSPDAVRYFRARYDARDSRNGDEADDRAASLARSNRTLEELSLRAETPWRERALATLASQLYAQRDYKGAAAAYQRYVQEFPESGTAWVSAIALGQAQAESRDFEAARQTLRHAAETHTAHPMARIAGFALAAQASAALGDFRAELADLKRAVDAWDPVYGSSFLLNGSLYIDPSGVARIFADPALSRAPQGLRRAAILARVAALPAMLTLANGGEFEKARWRIERGDWDGALPILERLAKDAASPFRTEASMLARIARLGLAMRLADVTNAQRDESAAAREFEDLAAGAQDFSAAGARFARAAVAWKQEKPDDARRWMREGMEGWRKNLQQIPAPAKGSLEEDVLAIYAVIFERGGSSSARGSQLYVLAPSVTAVKLSNDRTEEVTIIRAPDGVPNVLFLNREQEAFLSELLERFGASPDQFYEGTTLPRTPAVKVLSLFREYIPVAPGRWAGWQFYGSWISLIRFNDESRTKAEVSTTSGALGERIEVEKREGVWLFTKSAFSWIE